MTLCSQCGQNEVLNDHPLGRRKLQCEECRSLRSPIRYRSYGQPDPDTAVEGRQGTGLSEIAFMAYGNRREGRLRLAAKLLDP